MKFEFIIIMSLYKHARLSYEPSGCRFGAYSYTVNVAMEEQFVPVQLLLLWSRAKLLLK